MANPDQTLLGASLNVPTTQNKTTSHGNTFEQRLVDNGIFFNAYLGSTDPANMVEIKSIITSERPELCVPKFTDDDFVYYLIQDQSACNEATVLSTSFPLIVGKANIPNVRNAPLKRMLDLIKGVAPPQPDLFDGVRPETIAKSVLRQLGGYAQPSTINHHPAMSNFFVECTGPDGTMRVGMRQLSHDLASGARAMLEFRRFISADNAVDGHAYSFGATYLGGQGILTLFSCHPVSTGNTEQSMQYHVALVASYHLHLDRETFVKGVSAFRNLREFAQRVRERIRDAANLKASSAP
ncbi:hypothetical protein FH972_024209 [Carpinus fangiana]|uniref:Uncharacterized protein n=1 Tax=Carpinus fangiana TaxID=176857 RepID=A0A5N6KY79_9ROSI|nr:hypothetical protein FH972_024209 [Carpinus fangiana]